MSAYSPMSPDTGTSTCGDGATIALDISPSGPSATRQCRCKRRDCLYSSDLGFARMSDRAKDRGCNPCIETHGLTIARRAPRIGRSHTDERGRRQGMSRPPRTTFRSTADTVWQMSMPSILKRHGRVMCAQCGASRPAIFEGQQCVICGSAIDTAGRPHNDVDTVEPENHEAEEQHKVESNTLNAERAELAQRRLRLLGKRSSALTTIPMSSWLRKGWPNGTTIQCRFRHNTKSVLRDHGRCRPRCRRPSISSRPTRTSEPATRNRPEALRTDRNSSRGLAHQRRLTA